MARPQGTGLSQYQTAVLVWVAANIMGTGGHDAVTFFLEIAVTHIEIACPSLILNLANDLKCQDYGTMNQEIQAYHIPQKI